MCVFVSEIGYARKIDLILCLAPCKPVGYELEFINNGLQVRVEVLYNWTAWPCHWENFSILLEVVIQHPRKFYISLKQVLHLYEVETLNP